MIALGLKWETIGNCNTIVTILSVIGVRTVPVPHGLDGSVLRVPYPCRSELVSTTWTVGGQDGLGSSKTVIIRPSQPYRRLDGYLRSFSGLKIYKLADRSDHCSSLSLVSVIMWSLLCNSLQEAATSGSSNTATTGNTANNANNQANPGYSTSTNSGYSTSTNPRYSTTTNPTSQPQSRYQQRAVDRDLPADVFGEPHLESWFIDSLLMVSSLSPGLQKLDPPRIIIIRTGK
jgi:hypothetical protein